MLPSRGARNGLPLIVRNADTGAGSGGPPPEPPATGPPPPATEPDAPLGEAGEKALQIWKDRAKAAEADAKRAKELEAEVAKLREQTMTDQEKAIADARAEADKNARAEVLGTVNSRLFLAELKAATTGVLLPAAAQDLLAKPEVALALLGLDEYPVTDTGDIDGAAIAQKVAEYVAARPHQAADATSTPGPIDQGARTTSATAKSIDEQIAEAEAAGNWKLSGSLKTQQQLTR